MARWWTEDLDPTRHRDFMSNCQIGGVEAVKPRDRLIEQKAYFVEVASFTFQFASLGQVREALNYIEKRLHPSSMIPGVNLEHYWQKWNERLPSWLYEEPKRERVVSALSRALVEFESK